MTKSVAISVAGAIAAEYRMQKRSVSKQGPVAQQDRAAVSIGLAVCPVVVSVAGRLAMECEHRCRQMTPPQNQSPVSSRQRARELRLLPANSQSLDFTLARAGSKRRQNQLSCRVQYPTGSIDRLSCVKQERVAAQKIDPGAGHFARNIVKTLDFP
jgi:hypothetical protein